jgi:probable selenium-dependent hydroxylase accessory protein YqeC
MDLVEALDVETGITSIVGAGGKKSLMFALGSRLEGSLLTSTVRIPIFDDRVERLHVTSDPIQAVDGEKTWPIGLVPMRDGDRYLGYDPAVIDRLGRRYSNRPILVKADGARMREFKAPGTNEPRISETSDVVVAVVSMQALGNPLNEDIVHRPKRVRDITGRAIGEEITAEDIATVLVSEYGGRKAVPATARFVPILNKADSESDVREGRAIANRVSRHAAVSRVLITTLIDPDSPVVDVVHSHEGQDYPTT